MIYPYEHIKKFTIPTLINSSCKLYATKKALSKIGHNPIVYAQLQELIEDTAKLLQSKGIKRGDKVALLSENMPNWVIAYLSVVCFGAVIVPILPDFHPSDVKHIIKHSEVKAVFVSKKHIQTIEDIENSSLKFVIDIEKLEIIESFNNHDYFNTLKQSLFSSLSQNDQEVQEDDICSIIYTSGTTGHSKGVMLSHKNLVTNAMSAYKNIQITQDDTFLSILPLAHTLECTVGMLIPILHGADIVYLDKMPTPNTLLKAFKVVKPTMMLSVPLIIEKIYKNKILPNLTGSFLRRTLYNIPFFRKKINKLAGAKLLETFGGRLRFYGIGGAKLSSFVEEFLDEAEFPYIVGYGLTETSPLIAGTRINMKKKIGSTGLPMVGVEIKIKNQNSKNEGEICVKSPSVMLGYYKNEEQTKEVMENGWFLTGDLGYIDEDGYLFISGRSKNVLIGSGGENIFPEQIEAIINQNQSVLDSLVLMQDGKLIAKIHLDYDIIDKMFKKSSNSEIKQNIDKHLEEMRIDLNSKVSSYSKIVKFVEQREPFAKTPTKKIKRYLYL